MAFEITKMMTSVDETTTQDYVFVESEGDVKKINRNALLPFYTQAGHVAVSSGAAEITFATPFESTPRVVATYATGGSTTYNNYNEIVLTDITKNGFKIKLVGSYAGTFTIDWIAFAGSSIPAKLASLDVAAHATSLDPEDDATASVTASDINVYFEFGIPRGEKGDTGVQGPQGPQGPPGSGGMTTFSYYGITGEAGLERYFASIVDCYDNNDGFILQPFSGARRQNYYPINTNKVSLGENDNRYEFWLMSQDGYSESYAIKNVFDAIYLEISVTYPEDPGVPVYAYDYREKTFTMANKNTVDTQIASCEKTTNKKNYYNGTGSTTEYYSVSGVHEAIAYLATFEKIFHKADGTITAGELYKWFSFSVAESDRTKLPFVNVRATKLTYSGGDIQQATLFKNFSYRFEWDLAEWELVIVLDSAQAEDVYVEVWSDLELLV